MLGTISHILVRGIKCVVPKMKKHTLDYADLLGERRCKRQIKLTGVEERYVSLKKQKSSDLALEAAKELLAELQWKSGEIDVLVFATQNPLFDYPSTAFFLQKKLGIKKDCIVFDINLGCSAALVGIQIVSSLLLQGGKKTKGLLLISDAIYEISHTMDQDVVAERLLFGSAGAAVALEKDDLIASHMHYLTKSDGKRFNAIICRKEGSFYMDGEAVFAFGVNDVVNDLIRFQETFGIKEKEIDFYSFHQAQSLMLDTIASECSIDKKKELRSLRFYGNTNGCSVLLNLCANIKSFQRKKEFNLILCAFGVGLSWSYMNLTLRADAILPVSHSDKIYRLKC